MSLSTTGTIRSKLGSVHYHLKKKTTEAQGVLDDNPDSRDSSDVQDYVDRLKEAKAKLCRIHLNFQTTYDSWIAHAQNITDPNAQAEELKLFDAVNDQYIASTVEAEDAIEDANSKIDRLAKKIVPPQSLLLAAAPPVTTAAVQSTSQPPASTSVVGSTQVLPSTGAGPSSVSGSGAAQQPAPLPQSFPSRHTPIKPPKLSLPVFNGNYLEWRQFWGLFEANIHCRNDLTKIEKFTYLIQHLGDHAKQAISGLQITEPAYEVAVDLLKRRFDRADERLVSMLYSELKRIYPADRTTSSKQKVMDECERVFRQLQSAGEDVNSNRALTIDLLSKFPPEMIRDLQRHHNVGPNSVLDEARKAIEKYLTDTEATESVIEDLQSMRLSTRDNKQQSSKTNQTSLTKNNESEKMYVNSALVNVPKGQPNDRPRRPQMLQPPSECYFCGEKHFNTVCPNYATAKKRRARLNELGRCTRCMKKHDLNRRCPLPIRCVRCYTNEQHMTALCEQSFPDTGVSRGNISQHAANSTDRGNSVGDHGGTSGGVTAINSAVNRPSLFQTVKTVILDPKTGNRSIACLSMDTMSSRSYITEAAARKLQLPTKADQKLFVSVFGTSRTIEIPTCEVNFEILLRDGSAVEITANTTDIICKSSAFPAGWTEREANVLQTFKECLADDPFDPDSTIDVLVGSNLVWEFIRGARIATDSPNLFLIPSKFGMMLAGSSDYKAAVDGQPTMLCLTESPCQFPNELGLVSRESKGPTTTYPDVDEFWDLEKIGITDSPTVNEDDKALEVFKNSVSFTDGRYQVRWPWIPEKKLLLPTNYDLAYNRFRSLSKRLKSNDAILQGYRDVIHTQLERGIIELVPDSELTTEKTVHYLPHHPVVKESSNTTKIRIVYDAGSKVDKGSASLNECLMRGPVILPDLCQLLMRIRTHEIVVIADIEKAFLQISLHPDDRDTTRFLWFRNDRSLTLADNVAVYRFCRILFGAKPCPSILAETIDHHLSQEGTEFAEQLKSDTFVDNVFYGMNDDDRTIETYHQVKDIFARAGMNIQEFCSNSTRFMEFLPKADAVKNTDTKVLGVKWDSVADTIRLVPSGSETTNPVTKRSILRVVASNFDPLGLFQPVLLPAKVLLQRLWDLQYGWDDPVEDALVQEWNQLRESLDRISTHRMPRFIGRIDKQCTLAVFCDASGQAFATTVYLRCLTPDGKWRSNLLFAKSRLAPRAKKRQSECKPITLPRLELLGVVIGSRAAQFCREGLKAKTAKIDLFSDSECVLHWIRSKDLLKRFVARRVEEIRRLENCEFLFVGTNDNPADLSTRGKTADELFASEFWWHGPTWLTEDRTTWPRRNLDPVNDVQLREIEEEIKPVFVGHTLAVNDAPTPSAPKWFLGIDPAGISRLDKLLRVSVISLKFLKQVLWKNLPEPAKQTKPTLQAMFERISDEPTISCADFQTAREQWIRSTQQRQFQPIYEELKKPPSRPTAIVSQLGLKLDNVGLIRAYGRLEHADLPEDAKAPLLLPSKDRFTTLVIEDTHCKLMHSGVGHTLSRTRGEYWIVHGRATVRRVLRTCRICRIFKTAQPYKLPRMPPLPAVRLKQAVPFQFTGLDYFGPINVKVRDSTVKMWVCLFTCMVVRAVHLEPVMDCSTGEFLSSLIRFVSRRGVPQSITCDNAAQFRLTKILGDRAWRRTPCDDAIVGYAASRSIEWKFITELAPWQGGFYERLVGLVKSTLRSSIKRKILTWTDLVTVLAEAEAVVNSRPLSYVGDDPESRFRVLRPSDFLLSAPTSLDDSVEDQYITPRDFGEAGRRLLSIWKKRHNVLRQLWTYWQEEYLLSLRERPILSHRAGRSDAASIPRLNEIVILKETDMPRGRWKIARVTELITSHDGKVRSVAVLLPNGLRIKRPINLIVPLEIPSQTDEAHVDAGPAGVGDDSQTDRAHTDADSTDAGTAHDAIREAARVDTDGAAERADAEHDGLGDENDDDFFGFDEEDLRRTADALVRYDGSQAGLPTAPSGRSSAHSSVSDNE